MTHSTSIIILFVGVLIFLRFVLPWILYYAFKAAALGWLRGHNTHYDTLNGDADVKREKQERRTQGPSIRSTKS